MAKGKLSAQQIIGERARALVGIQAAALALGLLLSSCGLARLERSAEDLQSSKTAYEDCLRAAESIDRCAKEKAVYDADLAEYERATRLPLVTALLALISTTTREITPKERRRDAMPMARPKGVDPRVDEILENDRGNWFEDPYGVGFGRQRQTDPLLPGYEPTEAYRQRDIITWTWLDDIGLVDREGQYMRTEPEKRRGIEILKSHLEAIAKRLGEI